MKQKLLFLLMTTLCCFICNHSALAEEPIKTYSYNCEIVVDEFVFRIYLPDDFEKTLKGYAYLVGRDKSKKATVRGKSPKKVCIDAILWQEYQERMWAEVIKKLNGFGNHKDNQANNSETRPTRDNTFSFGMSAGLARQKTDTTSTTYSTPSKQSYYENSNTATSVRRSYNIDPDAKCTFELKLIGNGAFKGMTDLTEIEIPNTVTTIWPNAFKDCTNLKKVTLPESVVFIGWGAFQGCTSLESITIPKSVANIGDVAFRNCTSLKNFTFPESVVSIGWGVFWGCKKLEYVTLPNNLHEIPTYLVEDCPALKTVNIPTSMTSINSEVFWGTSLQTITIPEGIKLIDSGAFAFCENLRSVIIPKSLKRLATGAFCGCTSLQDIELNEGLEIIEEGAFFDSGIRRLTIPSTVKEIPEYTFQQCEQLESIVLPEGLEKLGMMAFDFCTSLKTIKIPNSLKRLNEKTFCNCSNLTKVEFDSRSQLKYIGPGCFAMCSSLREFDMPDSVTEIDDDSDDGVYMFMDTPIERLKMSASLTSFPPLYLDETLKEISFGENSQLTTIGELAFLDYKLLKHFQFPDKLKTIETRAFEGCENLEELIFPEGLTTIGYTAFYNCNKVAKIEFPLSIKSIGTSAFRCAGLKDVYVKWTENPYEGSGNEFYERWSNKWVLHIPKGTMSMYNSIEPWKSFKNIVEEGSSSDNLTLTAKSYTRAYGDANPTFEYTVTGGTITSGTPAITCSATATSPVGTYDIVISKGTVSNSTVNLVKGTLTITKAPLTISAGNYTKKEGENNPTFKATYSGFKNNETEAVLTKKPTITTTATKTSPAGSYPVTVSGAEAQNYNISYQNGTLTITASGTPSSNAEPYAVLSNDNTVLTFYYDNNKSSRGGMSVGPYWASSTREWYGKHNSITTVVFDNSFANCKTLTSTAYWFYECSNLKTIKGIHNLKTDNVIYMNSMFVSCASLTEIDLSSLNTGNVTRMFEMFRGCSNLKSINMSNFKTDNVTEMGSLFNDCASLTEIDLSSFNTEKVTGMSGMFKNCKNLKSINVSNFKSDNVTTMVAMFMNCASLTEINLSSFNTGKVTGMRDMFSGCSSLTNLDLSGFNTSNVTDMSFMFSGCSNLTSLDVSGFKTNNVTNMYAMFSGCSSLTRVDVSGFNTSNVTDMSFMFSGCSNLTSLDVSGFKTNNVTNMYAMFSGCSSLTRVDVSRFNTSNVTSMRSMFNKCSNLTSLDVSRFNTSNVTDMSFMFSGCSNLTSLDVSGFKTNNVTNMYAMFSGCSSLTRVDVSRFNTSNVTSMRSMFNKCSNLTSLDVSGFNTSNVTDMSDMFRECSSLTSLDLSGFNTSNVTDMSDMFCECSSLTRVDVSRFNTSNVTSMRSMFNKCSNLTSLDVSRFNTSNVTSMRDMFYGCNSLTSLDLSGFNTSNVTVMFYMFYNCTEIETIYVGSKWSTAAVKSGSFMFNGCKKLVGGAGTKYQAGRLNFTYAHIDGGTANPGYFTDIKDKNKNVTLTAKSYSRIYGDPNPTFEYTVTGGTITSGAPTITCSATATSPVGTYDIVIAKGTVSNSNVELVKGTLTITKAPLTISAGNYTKVEGEDNPTFTPTYSGFKNGETEAVLTKKPIVTCEANKDSEPGSYEIKVSGAKAQNYDISYVSGWLTIEENPNKFEEDDTSYEILDDGTVAITKDWKVQHTQVLPTIVLYDGKSYTVTVIGADAFRNNQNLTQITIPNTITSIGDGAFAGCVNLTVIIIHVENPIDIANARTRAGGSSVFEGVDKETCILYVPDGSVEAYKTTDGWNEFKNILPISALGIDGVNMDGLSFDVYNLQGRKVRHEATSLDGLPKGVYIINGRKVVK